MSLKCVAECGSQQKVIGIWAHCPIHPQLSLSLSSQGQRSSPGTETTTERGTVAGGPPCLVSLKAAPPSLTSCSLSPVPCRNGHFLCHLPGHCAEHLSLPPSSLPGDGRSRAGLSHRGTSRPHSWYPASREQGLPIKLTQAPLGPILRHSS